MELALWAFHDLEHFQRRFNIPRLGHRCNDSEIELEYLVIASLHNEKLQTL